MASSRVENQAFQSYRPDPCVLLVEGWSLGPLLYLKSELSRSHTPPVRVRQLGGHPMPPFLGLWFWDRNLMLMLVAGVTATYMIHRVNQVYWNRRGSLGLFLVDILLAALWLGWIRLMAAVAVRSSLQKGVELCRNEFLKHHVTVAVGFSWGAAVLAELLTTCLPDDDDVPAMLLIAPTTAAVAGVGLMEDAVFRISHHTFPDGLIHVVHATHDRMFCPHPERWEAIESVAYTMLPDSHIFNDRSNKRVLADIMISMLQMKTGRYETFWSVKEETPPASRYATGLRRSVAAIAESVG